MENIQVQIASTWSDFQRGALVEMGIHTLKILHIDTVDSPARAQENETLTRSEGTGSLEPTTSQVHKNNAGEKQAPSHHSVKTQPAEKAKLDKSVAANESIIERGQREAWKSAISQAHGSFVYAIKELESNQRVLVITESPNVTLENYEKNQQAFSSDKLANFTYQMLASIKLTQLDFIYWQEVIDYLPYERRDDIDPDVTRFQQDFSKLAAQTQPTHLLVFGQLAAKLILRSSASIGKLRGKTHSLRLAEKEMQVFALYHPAFLLRAPAHKKTQWTDLKAVYRALNHEEQPNSP